jgi:hypothetical protein
MAPGSLILLAPVRPGFEASLGQLLQEVGDDVRGRRLARDPKAFHIHFPESDRIHFARFALVEGPEGEEGRTRLLLASTFDGRLREHIRELTELTTDVDRLWGHCEGYTGVAGFPDFVRAHSHEPDAFYIAFRDGSVETVHRDVEIRRRIDRIIDTNPARGIRRMERVLERERRRRRRPLRLLLSLVRRGANLGRRFLRALPILWDVPRAAARYGLVTVWRASLTILATLNRYRAVRIFNRLVGNRLPPMGSHHSSLAPDRGSAVRDAPRARTPGARSSERRSPGVRAPEAPASAAQSSGPEDLPPSYREDAVAQNQLTLLTGVEPGQLRRLGAVLAAVDTLAKRLSPPGSLTGITTIHFVRWVILDEGRRLLMVSDYDGTWENYIDEFAEMILSGLDAIWGGATGAPPDGARDLPAFKDFLRTHQVPARVFYSAYPGTTTLNILSNRELAGALPPLARKPDR